MSNLLRRLPFVLLAGFLFSILPCQVYSQTGWYKIMNCIPDSCKFNDMWFTSESKGFAIGSFGETFMTTDGGANWQPFLVVNCDSCYKDYRSIQFAGVNLGFISGFDSTYNRDAVTYSTSDGGQSWIRLPQRMPATTFFSESKWARTISHMNNSGPCPLCGDVADYLSDDGGSSWTRFLTARVDDLSVDGFSFSTAFGDSINWLHSGSVSYDLSPISFSGGVLGSSNGGVSWGWDTAARPNYYFEAVPSALYFGKGAWMALADTIKAVQSGHILSRTCNLIRANDIAAPWDTFSYASGIVSALRSKSYQLNGFSLLDGKTAYFEIPRQDSIVFRGKIAKTTDFGDSFTLQTVSTDSVLLKVVRPMNDSVAYLLTKSGKIYKTISGGILGVETQATASQGLKVFPNPTANEVKIELPQSSFSNSIVVTDILGRERIVRTIQKGVTAYLIDLSGLEPGIYLLRAGEATTEVQVK